MQRTAQVSITLALAVALSACSTFGGGSRPSGPESTRVTIHVRTHDGKLIGSDGGGAQITVRDVSTNRIIAEGITRGGTGDTRRIMEIPRSRGNPVFTGADDARFEARLSISRPTRIEITAEGPLNYPDQMASASKMMTILPGGHITSDDGIVLELHGFLIDMLSPDTTSTLQAQSDVRVRARVRMLCSCPTQPDGMWRVDEVVARLMNNTEVIREVTLRYTGEPSIYEADLRTPESGRYSLEVIASRPDRATFGWVQRNVRVGDQGDR